VHRVVERERNFPIGGAGIGCSTICVKLITLELAEAGDIGRSGCARTCESIMKANGMTEDSGTGVEGDGESVPSAGDMDVDGSFDSVKFRRIELFNLVIGGIPGFGDGDVMGDVARTEVLTRGGDDETG
jgi:hypothetical protein